MTDPVAPPGTQLQLGPHDAITDVLGIEVGHYTHHRVPRGVTAVLCREGAAAGVSVRGSSPGTVHIDTVLTDVGRHHATMAS
ncbi:MAG TPA: P1 family peptidase [Thermomicrobiales bacterium]|nr:P1 family peptidase [Thermomicrobiales bacterium]